MNYSRNRNILCSLRCSASGCSDSFGTQKNRTKTRKTPLTRYLQVGTHLFFPACLACLSFCTRKVTHRVFELLFHHHAYFPSRPHTLPYFCACIVACSMACIMCMGILGSSHGFHVSDQLRRSASQPCAIAMSCLIQRAITLSAMLLPLTSPSGTTLPCSFSVFPKQTS